MDTAQKLYRHLGGTVHTYPYVKRVWQVCMLNCSYGRLAQCSMACVATCTRHPRFPLPGPPVKCSCPCSLYNALIVSMLTAQHPSSSNASSCFKLLASCSTASLLRARQWRKCSSVSRVRVIRCGTHASVTPAGRDHSQPQQFTKVYGNAMHSRLHSLCLVQSTARTAGATHTSCNDP